MVIATKVQQENLIKDADVGFYKQVPGAGKGKAEHRGEGKVVMASFGVVKEGRREMVSLKLHFRWKRD